MDEVRFIGLKKIIGDKGSVAHIIRSPDFQIKEVYMSSVHKNAVKGWKKHVSMTLNLVVIKGSVKFTFVKGSQTCEHTIGEENYGRLVVKPGCWVCFEGLDQENLIINCADMAHDPSEVKVIPFKGYSCDVFKWD
jgi:dTDP-4-dehydrorhamnose 3,5-epimerase